MNKTSSHLWRIVFGGLPAVLMAQGPQRRSLAVSGARLRGWLVCDGFQTLLVPHRSVQSVEPTDEGKWGPLALPKFRQ